MSILRQFLRSPRTFMHKAREAAQRMAEEPRQWRVPRAVSDDLPNLAWRRTVSAGGRMAMNVLIPALQRQHLSGGPNTALNLAYRLAAEGIPIRFVSCDLPLDDEALLRQHCAKLSGMAAELSNVSFSSMHDRSSPASVGCDDALFATAWWTAQYANRILRDTSGDRFLYLIQDFEPGFYKWSSKYALALETYGMPVQPVICGHLLAEYLQEAAVGRFADPEFVASSLVFEPAIDRTRFYADANRRSDDKQRLLFYARPEAPRNLFDIGLLALRQAVDQGAIDCRRWELWFIGGRVPPRDLGRGVVIRQHPWLDYDAYAALLRTCDVGLSLMMSPHTSYPPLELAACGATVVTNTFANKTAERLMDYSSNLVPAQPTVDSITTAILEAVSRTPDLQARFEGSRVRAPESWEQAFREVLPSLVSLWRAHEARIKTPGNE